MPPQGLSWPATFANINAKHIRAATAFTSTDPDFNTLTHFTGDRDTDRYPYTHGCGNSSGLAIFSGAHHGFGYRDTTPVERVGYQS